MKLNQIEKILWPLIIVIFFMTYHYYAFYQKDFNKIFQYAKPTLAEKQYDLIQEFHPFYYVYKTINDAKEKHQKVIYLKTRTEKNNAQFLDELNIMVNYFSYPAVIPAYSLKQIHQTILEKDTMIISDYPLHIDPKMNKKVIFLPFIKKNLLRINKWPEKDFYIYQVI